MMKKLALLLAALFALGVAQAQTPGTITFTASTTTGDESVVPVLTWSTSPAATSCTASGDWSGVKAAAGTETLAAITSSRTYNLTCSWLDNKATLTWVVPTENTDGTAYTDGKGFKIYYGTAPANLNQTVNVNGATQTTHTIQPLAAGTWHFAMTAVNQRDVESARTNTVSKVVGSASGNKSVGITVNPVPRPPSDFVVE